MPSDSWKFSRFRRIAPALLRAAVLTGAGIALPLIPGVAASPAAIDSIRTLLWSGAVLSLTVGGISPADQIMGLLRSGSSSSK